MTPIDVTITHLASNQHSCFSRRQALDVGFTYPQIRRRIAAGRWTRLHDNVLAISGAPPTWECAVMGALLALPDSVASHWSAALLWSMIAQAPSEPHVLRAHGRSHQVRGVVVHQSRCLPDHHVTSIGSFAVTTRARTIFDLASGLGAKQLGQLIDRQIVAGSLRPGQVEVVLAELGRPGRPGSARLATVIDQRCGTWPGASELESRFEQLCRQRKLPIGRREASAPWAEHRLHPERVDVAYDACRVIVELDGRSYHGRLDDFENDRRRDQLAAAMGWQTLRFTWLQITRDPDHVERILRQVLALER